MRDAGTLMPETGAPAPCAGEADMAFRLRLLEHLVALQMNLALLNQRLMAELLIQYGLQISHLQILDALAHRSPEPLNQTITGTAMNEISGALAIPPATATALIDRLLRRDLLQRTSHPKDRRIVLVSLTVEGRALTQRFHQHWRRVQSAAYHPFSDEQLQEHLTLLEQLYQRSLSRSGTVGHLAASPDRPSPPLHPVAFLSKDSL